MAQKYVPVALRRLVQTRPDHFCIAGGRIEPLSPTGRVTVRLLQLERETGTGVADKAAILRVQVPPCQLPASGT